jgi:methyl-accepting chemotaxis protein
MQAAMSTYAEDTIPALHEVQSGLLDLRREVKKHVISDESMLATAGRLKLTVAAMGLAALILGALLALIITRGITRPLKAAMIEVRSVADGDFTFTVGADYLDRGDELGEMIRDVRDMNLHLADTVRQVVQSADVVSSSSSEITRGNQDLSERTQRQAEAIEETASAMQELTAGVKQNASNSQEASRLAQEAAKTASQGGAVVEETEEAMAAVSESSNKISEITNVVNEIAFQTNLLALNAAVEAARAGEAGRGFAVVAGEVRNLAGRSAGAAKEIQKLISDSVEKVEQGNELVARSGKLLSDVIAHVQHVADTVSEVTAASQEQAQGIEEVNQAVSQMDAAVQQNAALVEEAAAASEEMASAAEKLRGLMGQFKLDEAAAEDETEASDEADADYGEPF